MLGDAEGFLGRWINFVMTNCRSWNWDKDLLVSSLSLLISARPLLASERPIDLGQSSITVDVGKSGLFSAAGHEHTVSPPIAEGAVNDSESAHIWFRVDAAKMTVLPEKDQELCKAPCRRSLGKRGISGNPLRIHFYP